MTDEENDRFAKALEDIKAFGVTMDEAASCTLAVFDKLKTVMRDGDARGVVFLSTMGSEAMYPGKAFEIKCFDEWNKFLSKPITKAELGTVVNPKNKPYYRQFEGGKKWKF